MIVIEILMVAILVFIFALVFLTYLFQKAKELIEFYLTRKKEMIEALEQEMEADQVAEGGIKFRSH